MYGHTNPTIRTTEDNEQVGPKMHSAVIRVHQRGPYSSKNELAISVGPNGSQDYGYRIVDRCISKGLLTLDNTHPDATPRGRGAVILTQKGLDYLHNNTELFD
jgi:hypothetical protein